MSLASRVRTSVRFVTVSAHIVAFPVVLAYHRLAAGMGDAASTVYAPSA